MKKYFNQLKKEIRTHKLVYLFLAIILSLAFFVRVYRVDQILGFYYDQGRDALVIWDLWHNGKFFLIGPTTGIEGIFRGPWYYWLIAPFYLIGNGNPVWSSVFLAFTTVVAVALIYLLGAMVLSRITGLLAAFIASFPFYLVYASRWLSNPTPMFLISMLLVLSMFLVLQGRKWAWVLIGFILGLSMQFGSAAELFYFPAVLVFAVWQRDKLPSPKVTLFAFCFLLITFLPQIIFDLRHDGVLSDGIKRFLFTEKSFGGSTAWIIETRVPFYFDVFNNKLFLSRHNPGFVLGAILLFVIFIKRKIIFSNEKFLTLCILFVTPLVGMLFFRGNYGNVYDYYFTGYYLIFILIFSSLLGMIAKEVWGKTIIIIFLFVFLQINLTMVIRYINSDPFMSGAIFLGNQKASVDWVYKDAGGQPFNVDVYVPPVVPYAYDYLFLWWGQTRYGKTPIVDQQLSLLYTLYEHDPPHPDRIGAWLARQERIGKVLKEEKFGAITVQRRQRLPNNLITQ